MTNPSQDLRLPSAVASRMPAVVAKAEQYFGSFVRIEFKAEEGRQFGLRIEMADWALSLADNTVATSSGGAEKNNFQLALLIGSKLTDITAFEKYILLIFSTGATLKVEKNLSEYEAQDELLVITLENAFVAFSNLTGFTLEPRTKAVH